VEGKFSSSKCASISQMCKREPPGADHLLFIANRKATSRYTLHWAKFGGDRRCTVASIAKATDATGASVAPPSSHMSRPLEFTALTLYTSDASVATDRRRLATIRCGPVAIFAECSTDASAAALTDAVSVCRASPRAPEQTLYRQTRQQCPRPRLSQSQQRVCRTRQRRLS
jgi:hypothetical protein